MVTVEEIRKAQRARGTATVLAIGTATPSNCIYQADFPDFYFRITNSEHLVDLKGKFKRMCENSMIKKRYMHLDEKILKENPNMCEYMASSLDVRQDMVVVEIPRLGKEAATKAIKEWGQPKSKITHLIFCCFAGGTVLRLTKDLAENNAGARVLVVCSEMTAIHFRGPSEAHLDSMVGQVLFGDGASAVIVGADPDTAVGRPSFEIVSAGQTIVPNSEGAIEGHLREVGLTFHLLKDVPSLVSDNIEKCLKEAFAPIGIKDWNSLFWIAHPGGRAILDKVEANLGLKEEKLRASRHVLSEYGNMSSACVLFILDEMRKKSSEEGKNTTGEGLDWGVLFGFGPGFTIETVVLHSIAT
ncbi:hypothetical protein GIB67_033298 [Kingdonia uniflora]|uniref:Chalcone synthase n=1 Tax=Kingdonia uniflora TaxID=39325 RepID=A0A7J7MA41_9MAGN|nr:hypothetical protein GIB67_033298 [Kingdonia uniflora]